MAKPAKIARPTPSIDADEAGALAAAAATLQTFARVENAEAVAHCVISTWIIERMKRAVSARKLADNLVFDLSEAKMRGRLEAMLPNIAESLGATGFDFSQSFNDLSKDTVVSLFLAGCVAWREAAVAAGESADFPFDDTIPFGAEEAA